MTIKTTSLLGNSISLEEDSRAEPSSLECLNEALRDVGCESDGEGERTDIYYVHRRSFKGKIVAVTSTWFDLEDDESPFAECRVDLDRDFAKEWWNVLLEKMLPVYVSQHISHWEVESEVFGWGSMTDKRREKITRLCSDEIQKFFSQLD